jgi:hypothetical protein
MTSNVSTLLLGKCTTPLEVQGEIPNEWVVWDRLSQGQISRLKYNSHTILANDDKKNAWFLIKVFREKNPQWIALWTQTTALNFSEIKELFPDLQSCFYLKDNLSAAEEKAVLKLWPESQSKEFYEL